MELASDAPAARTAFVRDGVTWLAYLSLGYLIFLGASMGTAMPSLRQQLGMGYTLASLHFTAVAGGSVLTALFGDRIARAWGRQRAFWYGGAGVTAGGVLFVAVPHPVATITGALMIGMGGTLLAIVAQAGLADRHGEQRAVAMVEINLAASLGAVLGAAGIGLAEQTGLGWRAALLLVSGATIVAASLLRGARFPAGMPARAGARASREPLPRLFWLLCIAATTSAGTEWGFAYWGADYLHEVGGLSVAASATAMASFFLAMAAGRFAGSWIARRFRSEVILIAAFSTAIAGFALFWLSGSIEFTLAGLAIAGLGISNIYPAIASIATGLVPHRTDVAIARLLLTGSMAVLAAPFVLGVLGDLVGIRMAFLVIAPILGSGLVLAAVAWPRLAALSAERTDAAAG
jgi:MFS family permease